MIALRIALLTVLCAFAGVAWGANAAMEHTVGTLEQLKALPSFQGVAQPEALHQAALKGKDQYRMLVNQENFKMMGLEGPGEASAMELGTPTRDFLVRLDKLRAYKRGDDPQKLLSDTGLVHYPVQVGNETRGAVTVAMRQGEWKVASIGEASRSQKRSLAQRQSAKTLNKTEGNHFSVRVAALNLEFVGATDSANQLQLTPIQDAPQWDLKAGVPQPASTVFLKLVPAAQEHDNLPH